MGGSHQQYEWFMIPYDCFTSIKRNIQLELCCGNSTTQWKLKYKSMESGITKACFADYDHDVFLGMLYL